MTVETGATRPQGGDRDGEEAPPPPYVRSIQVGLPRHAGSADAPDAMDRPWTSAIWKEEVAGPVWCGRVNLAGDGQADLSVHGGPEKAVLGYAASHYPAWRREPGLAGAAAGAFGENLTIEGLTEATVCIGDTMAIGGAVLQLSQPRGPCWKLARRWRIHDLAARVQRSGRTGWYYRVLEEGEIAPGQPVAIVDRPFPEWTVERVNRVRYGGQDDGAASALAALPLLSPGWRRTMQRLARDAGSLDERPRLIGPNVE